MTKSTATNTTTTNANDRKPGKEKKSPGTRPLALAMDKAAKEAPSPKKAREESRSATEQVIDVLKESRSALGQSRKANAALARETAAAAVYDVPPKLIPTATKSAKRNRTHAVSSEVMTLKCAYDFSTMDELDEDATSAFIAKALTRIDKNVRYSAVELCIKRVTNQLDNGSLDLLEYGLLLDILKRMLSSMVKPSRRALPGDGKVKIRAICTQKAPALVIRFPHRHPHADKIPLGTVMSWTSTVNEDGKLVITATAD